MYVLALREGLEKRYDDFSMTMQGFAARNKNSGALEILPADAFVIVPLITLLPELNKVVQDTIALHASEIAPKLADSILEELAKSIKDEPSGQL